MAWCATCSRSFVSNESLQQHYTSSKAHIYCEPCDRYFREEAHLRQHEADSSAYAPPPYCHRCQLYFDDEDELDDHIEDSDMHHECWICDDDLPTYANLCQHVVHIHGWLFCDRCQRCFVDEVAIKQHLSAAKNHHVCSLCGQDSPTEEEFKSHLNMHRRREQTSQRQQAPMLKPQPRAQELKSSAQLRVIPPVQEQADPEARSLPNSTPSMSSPSTSLQISAPLENQPSLRPNVKAQKLGIVGIAPPNILYETSKPKAPAPYEIPFRRYELDTQLGLKDCAAPMLNRIDPIVRCGSNVSNKDDNTTTSIPQATASSEKIESPFHSQAHIGSRLAQLRLDEDDIRPPKVVHRPGYNKITCFGCSEQFTAYHSMISHLEGECPFEIDRRQINRLSLMFDSSEYVVAGREECLEEACLANSSYYDGLIQAWDCPGCHRTFKTQPQLEIHLKQSGHALQPYMCPNALCREPASTLHELLRHVEKNDCDGGVVIGVTTMGKLMQYIQRKVSSGLYA